MWESVSVAPVRTPDGNVTVPEGVIHSMQKNKIGLKGMCSFCADWGTQCYMLCRSSGDTGREGCSVT